MGWGQRWPQREPRPTAARLDATKLQEVQARLQAQLSKSHILVALGLDSRVQRGRFYLESRLGLLGRITPLAGARVVYLLEAPRGKNWTVKGRGIPEKLIEIVADDDLGTFHGLGALGRALLERGLDVEVDAQSCYPDGSQAGVHEFLFYRLGVPIEVLAEPRDWYLVHRSPHIVECDTQQRRVLVSFVSHSSHGEAFSGRCLYVRLDGQWRWFKVRPNQSQNIETALTWLEKRNWQGWP